MDTNISCHLQEEDFMDCFNEKVTNSQIMDQVVGICHMYETLTYIKKKNE